MITPEQWKEIEKQANKLYTNLELEIIQEIAERIANVGYANTVALNDILIAQEMGMMYQDIINLVGKYNNSSVAEVKSIFEEAGIKSLEYDDNRDRLAGLQPTALKQSSSMWQLLGATALKTHNNLSNLVMTTASTSQTQFYNAMNKAYMEVSTGVKSYSQSIIDTIKEVSKQGTYITYPSGQNRSVEAAVRMNIPAVVCKLYPCHHDGHDTCNVCDIPHRGADDLSRHFGIVGDLGIRPYREQGDSSPSYYPCCADDVLDADANPQTYGVPLCVSPWNVVLVRLLCIYDLDPAALPFRNKIYRQAGGL